MPCSCGCATFGMMRGSVTINSSAAICTPIDNMTAINKNRRPPLASAAARRRLTSDCGTEIVWTLISLKCRCHVGAIAALSYQGSAVMSAR